MFQLYVQSSISWPFSAHSDQSPSPAALYNPNIAKIRPIDIRILPTSCRVREGYSIRNVYFKILPARIINSIMTVN